MACESAFLNLPRELRDEIYQAYITFEDGLVYNFEYGHRPKSQNLLRNLAPVNKQHRMDLAFRSTCKQIHKETEGLVLKFNTITFSSTRFSRRMNSEEEEEEVRIRAARFHYMRVPLTMEAASFLYYEDGTVVRPCYTDSVVDEVVRTHPSIGPLLRTLCKKNNRWTEVGSAHQVLQARLPDEHGPYDRPGPTRSWGIVPSSFRRAVMHALQVTADQDLFSSGPAAQRPTFPPREMLALDSEFPAWSIPSNEDLAKLFRPYAWKRAIPTCDDCSTSYCHSSHQVQTAEFWTGPRYYEEAVPANESPLFRSVLGPVMEFRSNNRAKYRFSAASVAIKFISSLPINLRFYLRHIRLLENNVCVAFPESHAQGLIPFCKENHMLRVERRVNVWKAIFQQPHLNSNDTDYVNCLDMYPEHQHLVAKMNAARGFPVPATTSNLALWLMEATALVPAGMPENSFTLVLDGAPGDDAVMDLFMKYTQRDAARQRAWEICSERASGEPGVGEQDADDRFMRLRCPPCYFYEGFPQVVEDMINNRSKVIRCTFNPGPKVWDAEVELNNHPHYSGEMWTALRWADESEEVYWRELTRHEHFGTIVYEREVLPYKEDDEDFTEYFSD